MAEEMAALPSKYARDVERVRRRHAKTVAALLAERAKKMAGMPPASVPRPMISTHSLVGESQASGSSMAASQCPTMPSAPIEEAEKAQAVVRAKYGTAPRELSLESGRLASGDLEAFKHTHPVRAVNLRASV
jgi:hypothetical protein